LAASRPACREAAYRERKRVHEAVTTPSDVAAPGTRSTPATSENAPDVVEGWSVVAVGSEVW
ncbi:hypothetical protein, partial [Streptomyces sp. NPDC057545]|uniref:hypothetical protein n=1 Tax=Streptomyces sp. NPDC057545 TaxID=3346164 RepID=UPI0036B71202